MSQWEQEEYLQCLWEQVLRGKQLYRLLALQL